MVKSMTAAIAGLKAHQTKMDVLGNNIANVNTWGYKSSVTNFQDAMYSNQIVGSSGSTIENGTGGVNTSQMGYGTVVSSISKNFTVGSQQYTGNALDCMIDGSGFFIVGNYHESASLSLTDGGIYLSRVGIFSVDNNGYLVDDSGHYVYGFATTMDPATGEITVDSTQLIPIQVPNAPSEDANGFQAYKDGNGNTVYYNADNGKYYSVVSNPTNLIRQYNQQTDENTGYLVYTDTDGNSVLYDSANDVYYRSGEVGTALVTTSDLTRASNLDREYDGMTYSAYQLGDGSTIYQNPKDGSYCTITEEKSLMEVTDTTKTLGNVQSLGTTTGTIDGETVKLEVYYSSETDTTYYYYDGAFYDKGVGSEYTETANQPTNVTVPTLTISSKNQEVGGVLYDVYTNMRDETDTNYYYVDQDSGKIYSWDGTSMKSVSASVDVYSYPTGLTAVEDTTSFKTDAVTGFQEFQDTSGNTIYYDAENKIYYAATDLGANSTVNPILSDSRYDISTYTIGTDGSILGVDVNGKVVSIGMLAVASVENVNGLEQNSGYLYTIGRNAGTVTVMQTTAQTGAIKSNYLEMSNTDLASDIATMITTQRGYQANTKIITVTDEMLEELVSMKR